MNGTVNPDREDEDNACFPSELRFVRCGRRERWREANLGHQEIHFGWSEFPHSVLQRKDLDELKDLMTREYTERKFKNESARKTALSNSLRELLDALQPECFTWITIAHDKLWWCTAKQGIEVARMKQTLKDISPHVVTEHGQINR
jgi:hypothetical protein